MSRSMPTVEFLFLWFLSTATLKFSSCKGNQNVVCMQSEKQALLSFKQGLIDPAKRLLSWDAKVDCCKWAGVVCDNLTGYVLELHLGNPYCYYETEADYILCKESKLGGEMNHSLLNLKHLSYLDLSCNGFEGISIPSFIGSLVSLHYLNLSRAEFAGTIPHQLGNLSSLRFLDLGGNYMYSDNLQWLSDLSTLEHLDLTAVNLTKETNWLQEINTLPSLVELHLRFCALDNIPPILDVNFTSLAVLDLSWNNFNSLIPSDLSNITSLRYLDMSSNDLNSTIPDWLYSFGQLEFLNLAFNNLDGGISDTIGNLTSIVTLELSWNNLGGRLPRSLGNLCNLRVIELSNNKFKGEWFRYLSVGCIVHALESLSLSENQFSGHLTSQLGQFKNLRRLDLSGNLISGSIPVNLGKLSSLEELDLSENQLNGPLPESLGNLSKLEVLLLSENLLEGIVSDVHFTNLKALRTLDASGNQLTLEVSRNWIPPFQLEDLKLRSWHLGPQFPIWVQTQKLLSFLDLSYTGISGTIPTWFSNFSCGLVDLSSNQLSGPVPFLSPHLGQLSLSNNSFHDISQILCDRKDEPKYLKILDLNENLLSGEIPNCWMNWQLLRVIDLGNNNLTGSIPSSMGLLENLASLHLRNNSLSGELPLSLRNCTWLKVVDLSKNAFVGSIPRWIGERLSNLRILSLRSNKLNGIIPSEICYLKSIQILDLANNNLSGAIPWCIDNFTSMAVKGHLIGGAFSYFINGTHEREEFLAKAFLVTKGLEYKYDTILRLVTSIDLSENNIFGEIPEELTSLDKLLWLNLSGNHLTGIIPKKIGDMGSLESLDFSRNQLSGEIPLSISDLAFLSHLNLSCNKLLGKIPSGTQLQSFNASSFIGNRLCGPPLTKNCSVAGETPNVGIAGDNEGAGPEVDWFYVLMGLGFVVGFWGTFGPILFIKSCRYAYFEFLDSLWNKLCVVKNNVFRF